MENQKPHAISVSRLRFGVVFLFLWWIPWWIVTPTIADIFGISHSSKHSLVIKVVVTQTILGLIGALIAGKEVVGIIKHTPFKKVPKTVYVAVRHGKIL